MKESYADLRVSLNLQLQIFEGSSESTCVMKTLGMDSKIVYVRIIVTWSNLCAQAVMGDTGKDISLETLL